MPPGTSKWNQVEHRLFSYISMNWRGRPLTSHDVIVNTIAATTTRTGLRVEAELDTNTYDTAIKVTDAEIDALAMSRHRFHGDWNYTLHLAGLPPAPGLRTDPATAATTARPAAGPAHLDSSTLRHPELTGMTVPEMEIVLDNLIPALAEQRERLRHERRGGERRRHAARAPRTSSPTPIGSWPPCSTCAKSVPTTCSPSSSASPEAPSPALSRKYGPSSPSLAPRSRRQQPDSAHRRRRCPPRQVRQSAAKEDQTSMLILCAPLDSGWSRKTQSRAECVLPTPARPSTSGGR